MKSGLFGLIIAVFIILSLFLPNIALAASYGERETIVILIDLKDSSSFRPNELRAFAAKNQKPVNDLLERNKGAVLNRFWLNNSILVKVSYKTILELRSLQGVEAIYPNFEVRLPPKSASAFAGEQRPWGIDKIGAPDVWAKGIKGSGVRIAVLDTGVDITHPDLTGKMWTDNSSDPTYPGGWIEFDEDGNIVKGSVPHDTNGHGTHTSGTALGGNAGGKEIGVAPEAKLMHALILPEGGGTFSQVIAGMQWAIEPFDQNGNTAGQPADIVSMSWGAAGYVDEMIAVINKMREVGVIPVAAIGNGGEGSSGSPGNVYQTFAVGATNQSDEVAWFSSGELVDWPQSYPDTYIKPDFAAPGVSVLSAFPGGGYESWDGTSMATPHVAGTVGLLLNSKPDLSAIQIYQVLAATSNDKGDAGQDIRYGFGIINADKAVSALSSGIQGSVVSRANGTPLKVNLSVKDSQGKIIFSSMVDGNYLLYLLPGSYEITAGEFWHNSQTVAAQVQENVFTRQDFSLTAKPVGTAKGKVKDKTTDTPVDGAKIIFEKTPVTAKTDTNGEYSAVLPVGTYNIKAYADKHLPSATQAIELKNGVIATADFRLEPFLAAIMGDWNNQIHNFFSQTGFPAETRGWDIVQNIAGYNAIIVNLPDDPGKATFLNFINAAQQNKVGLIFTSSFPGENWPYGITLLQKYLNNPREQDYEYGYGPVSYKAVFPHPIFKGLEQGTENTIMIIDKGDMDFAWFWNYSGVKVADISAEGLQPENGSGVAFDLSHGNSQLLLAGLAAQPWTGVRRWTDQGRAIFTNSVKWAGMKPAELTLDKREAVIGERITLTGAGFTSLEGLQIYIENLLITETEANNSGSFSLAITVPEMPADTHNLVALGSSGKMGAVKLKVKPFFSAETNLVRLLPGAKIRISGKGFGSKSEVKLYYNGSLFQVAAADESGSFSDMIAIPFATIPGLQQLMAIDEKSNFGTTSFTITNEWMENLSNSVSEIKSGVTQLQAGFNQGIAAITKDIKGIDANVAMVSNDMLLLYKLLGTVDAKVTGVDKGVALVQTDMGNVRANLRDLDAKVIAVSNNTVTIQTLLGLVQTGVNNLDAKITGVDKGVALVQTELGSVKAGLKDLDAKIITVKDSTVTIQTSLGVVQTGINNLDAKVIGIEKGIVTIETELGVVKVGLKDIDANILQLRKNTVLLQSSLGTIQTGLDNLDAKVVNVSKGIAFIETSVGILKGEVIRVQNNIAEVKTDIGVVRLEIKDADVKTNNRLDEIQDKIGRNFYILLGFAALSLATVVAVVYLRKK